MERVHPDRVPRPLDRLQSIKVKLGLLIVVATLSTGISVVLAVRLGLRAKVGVGLATLAALALVQLLAHGMTSPLRQMAAAADAMAAGDYGATLTVTATSRDEVGQLARAFTRMAADLAEVDRQRRDLVANVSHELRTPIAGLQARLENLVDGVEAPDPEVLATMLRSVERLGRLVSDLLDLSRLESGSFPIAGRPFPVADVVEDAVEEARLHAGSVSVLVDVVGDPLANGDPERVHQVLANLLENAVRHSPVAGTVVVRARPSPETHQVRIEVTDQGPGIPPAERDRVFERFYRADRARSSSDGGSGLGLAIARGLVELQDGAIRAEGSDAGGCVMVVDLPAP